MLSAKHLRSVWQHTHSVVFRLILTFSIVVLPIAATGYYVNSQGYAMLSEQTAYSMSQQMGFNISALESQLLLANEQVYQLINEKESRRYACRSDTMSSYEYVYHTNTLLQRIQTIYLSNDFVERVELFLPQLDRSLRSHLGSDPTVMPIAETDYDSAHKLAQNWSRQVQYGDERLYGMNQVPSAVGISAEAVPWIVSRITFDMEEIEGYLAGILPDIPTECVLMTSDGEVIVGERAVDEDAFRSIMAAIDASDARHRVVDVSDRESLIMGCYSSVMNAYYVVYAGRADVFTQQWLYRDTLVLLIVLSVLALSVYAVMVCRQVHAPLKQLERAFERLAGGDMDFAVPEDLHGDFGALMCSFNQMLTRLREAVRQLYEQRILMQQAQLKQMQAQINPHFLYNSFFILNNMIAMEDYEAASMFSKRLGEYFRYVTRDARDTVSLGEEYAHVRSYVDVQLIRFGRRISAELPELTATAARIMVPRLSLQPIVENAFVHSLEHKRGQGLLKVRIQMTADGVAIEVENNGAEDMRSRMDTLRESLCTDAPQAERSGLKNVHQRLLLIQGQGLGLRFEEPDRFIVRMVILADAARGRTEYVAAHTDSGR